MPLMNAPCDNCPDNGCWDCPANLNDPFVDFDDQEAEDMDAPGIEYLFDDENDEEDDEEDDDDEEVDFGS